MLNLNVIKERSIARENEKEIQNNRGLKMQLDFMNFVEENKDEIKELFPVIVLSTDYIRFYYDERRSRTGAHISFGSNFVRITNSFGYGADEPKILEFNFETLNKMQKLKLFKNTVLIACSKFDIKERD